MPAFAWAHGWDFLYLHAAPQEVARADAAACTPDFCFFDAALKLVYAGQFDDSRPGRGTADSRDLATAVEHHLAGRKTPPPWFPSTGCNIKWKRGNEPEWSGEGGWSAHRSKFSSPGSGGRVIHTLRKPFPTTTPAPLLDGPPQRDPPETNVKRSPDRR
jgi:hypothetical protein